MTSTDIQARRPRSDCNTDYTSNQLGRSQYDVLAVLADQYPHGCSTAKVEGALLHKKTPIHIRGIQDSLRRLGDRGLVDKVAVKHNKNEWYFKEGSQEYLDCWPQLPKSGCLAPKSER